MNLLLTIIYLSYYSAHAFSINQSTASPSKTTTAAPTSSNTINAKKHNIPRFKYQQGVFVNFDLKNSEKSTPKSPEELAKIASDYAIKQLNLKDKNDFNVHQKTVDLDGRLHWKCQEKHNGIIVSNSAASVNVDKFGNITSASKSWVRTDTKAPSKLKSSFKNTSKVSIASALNSFAKLMKLDQVSADKLTEAKKGDVTLVKGASFSTSPIKVRDRYYRTEKNGLELSYSMIIRTKNHIYNCFVGKESGKVLAVSDWASKPLVSSSISRKKSLSTANTNQVSIMNSPFALLTRKITDLFISNTKPEKSFKYPSDLKAGNIDISEKTVSIEEAKSKLNFAGSYSYQVTEIKNISNSLQRNIIDNPADGKASPLGWHSDGVQEYKTTIGNNAIVQENWEASEQSAETGSRPFVAKGFDFRFPVDDKNQNPREYVDASATNLFYLTNWYHDLLYAYGFREQDGNFQQNNFSKGGRGGDAVIANVQDGSGTDNANFLSPEDGEPGVLNMFTFNTSDNQRDASLDTQVAIHELSHGLSNRLTGGPQAANCMDSDEAGGLGEGISDFVAIVLTMPKGKTRDDDIAIGAYAQNSDKGVRSRKYSTSLKRNDYKYSDAAKKENQDVHALGEIWMSMMFEVYWNFVDELGYTENLKEDVNSGKGNSTLLKLLVDALKIQPCNPTFIQARDALLEVDRTNGGKHFCLLYKGFAKRGMGVDASNFEDNFSVPSSC